jgi:hypothetical protein
MSRDHQMPNENDDIKELIGIFRANILAIKPWLTEREIDQLVQEALKEPQQS